MKKIIILLTALSLPLSILCAEEEENDTDQKSSNLTPNAPRPVTMANPNKPAWLAEPHGK